VPLRDEPLAVGRAEDNDIVLPEHVVSRLHCVISLVGGRPSVLDQGSRNGTYLGGNRIRHAWLEHDDVVRVGWSTLRIEAVDLAARPARPTPRAFDVTAPVARGAEVEAAGVQLALIYRLGALLASSVDVPSTTEAVVDLVLEALPGDRVFVLSVEGKATERRLGVMGSGVRSASGAAQGAPSRRVVELTVERGRAVHAFDSAEAQSASVASPSPAGARTVLSAPLRYGEEIFGVLYVDAPTEPGAASLEGSLALFEGIADQAALALGRARLHRSLLEKNEELRLQRDRLDELSRRLGDQVRHKTALADGHAAELAVHVRELEQLQAAREAMARSLVHDIRNVAGAIESNVRFLRPALGQGSEEQHAADDALEGLRRAVAMAEDVLVASRIESGALVLRPAPIPVSALLEATRRRHAGHARDLGVELTIDPVPEGLLLTGDADLLDRVMDNMVDNGLRHAGLRGCVALSATHIGRRVELTVTDTGPGVPEREREHVFDEWHGSNGVEQRPHGIGLHFCRLAVEAHGGTIQVGGGPGRSQFRVFLPTNLRDEGLDNTVADRPTAVSFDEEP
jgi:signal transduction histidine kinase